MDRRLFERSQHGVLEERSQKDYFVRYDTYWGNHEMVRKSNTATPSCDLVRSG